MMGVVAPVDVGAAAARSLHLTGRDHHPDPNLDRSKTGASHLAVGDLTG